jgi:cell wall-associated NlpC family hydrolase
MHPLALALGGVATVIGLPLAALSAVGGATSALTAATTSAAGPVPTAAARADIPPAMLVLYERSATICTGLPWTVVAAIGTVESDNGRSEEPGVHSGANEAGAEGPMQFEPSTFAAYDQPVPPGGARPANPYDPTDAVYAAVRYLCTEGGYGDADIPGAIWAYNHSEAYVARVIAIAAHYGETGGPGGSAARVALAWALGQVGTPYVWGGEKPGVGFDCSGLVQDAYLHAGISLPRVAQSQYDAGPAVASGASLEPGDLVFFGGSETDVDHVGMVVRPGVMVDAPHTGAYVRVEDFPSTPGAAWGTERYIGATRPAG